MASPSKRLICANECPAHRPLPRNAPPHHAAHIPLPKTFHPQLACWGPRAGLREAGSLHRVSLPLGPGGTRASQGHLTRQWRIEQFRGPGKQGSRVSGLSLCSSIFPASPHLSPQCEAPTPKPVASLVMSLSHRWWSQARRGTSLSHNGAWGSGTVPSASNLCHRPCLSRCQGPPPNPAPRGP